MYFIGKLRNMTDIYRNIIVKFIKKVHFYEPRLSFIQTLELCLDPSVLTGQMLFLCGRSSVYNTIIKAIEGKLPATLLIVDNNFW